MNARLLEHSPAAAQPGQFSSTSVQMAAVMLVSTSRCSPTSQSHQERWPGSGASTICSIESYSLPTNSAAFVSVGAFATSVLVLGAEELHPETMPRSQ